ncbi:MAG: TrbG/VirB9 family P-type conjugative transfer protein [Erythrobacter sp.]|nr:TrbG/VirB9 family P-type conjugative transfer protein [Erythrobacter sp.]MDZ4272677.1 TrbG/VirB9 family P-type conjugative transfer protein [Erythrobacter sp.]
MKPAITLACLMFACAAPLAAQVFPMPGPETPRIQTAEWRAGEALVLTALPQTALTVMLEPGETIQRATLGGSPAWEVVVSAEADSFQITPRTGAVPASLSVETDRRAYSFLLETGDGLQAAYLVRLQFGGSSAFAQTQSGQSLLDLTGLDWTYRLRGDQSVRPTSIRDNGAKTVIEYAPGQSLPAVFAIGPTGDEEVVDGYMRDGLFVIDRVHEELVFRIDKAKAAARRGTRAVPQNGGEG